MKDSCFTVLKHLVFVYPIFVFQCLCIHLDLIFKGSLSRLEKPHLSFLPALLSLESL